MSSRRDFQKRFECNEINYELLRSFEFYFTRSFMISAVKMQREMSSAVFSMNHVTSLTLVLHAESHSARHL